ncbi:hypothetical protein ACMFMG_001922 [Clarireedia jacksonii]
MPQPLWHEDHEPQVPASNVEATTDDSSDSRDNGDVVGLLPDGDVPTDPSDHAATLEEVDGVQLNYISDATEWVVYELSHFKHLMRQETTLLAGELSRVQRLQREDSAYLRQMGTSVEALRSEVRDLFCTVESNNEDMKPLTEFAARVNRISSNEWSRVSRSVGGALLTLFASR